MTIRSKHNNLLNYFIHDRRDLSPAYVRSCETFFHNLRLKKKKGKKIRSQARKRVGPPVKNQGSSDQA